jgi:hypothetical protein
MSSDKAHKKNKKSRIQSEENMSLLDQTFANLETSEGNTSSSSNQSSSNRNLVDNSHRGTLKEPQGVKNLIPQRPKSTGESLAGLTNPQVLTKVAGDTLSTISGASGKSAVDIGRHVNADIIRTNLANDDSDDSRDGSGSEPESDLHDARTHKTPAMTNNKNNDNSALNEQLFRILRQLGALGDDPQDASLVNDILANISNANHTNNNSMYSEPKSNHSNGRLIQTTVELSVLSQSVTKSIQDYSDKTETWEMMHGELTDRASHHCECRDATDDQQVMDS